LPGEVVEGLALGVSAITKLSSEGAAADLLRLWRLTAVAHPDPGFEERLRAVRRAVQAGSVAGSAPVEQIVPGWPDRV